MINVIIVNIIMINVIIVNVIVVFVITVNFITVSDITVNVIRRRDIAWRPLYRSDYIKRIKLSLINLIFESSLICPWNDFFRNLFTSITKPCKQLFTKTNSHIAICLILFIFKGTQNPRNVKLFQFSEFVCFTHTTLSWWTAFIILKLKKKSFNTKTTG